MMYTMIRTPILLAIAAASAPAHAAPSGAGWKVDTGGAFFGVANKALRVISTGDMAAVNDDIQGPRLNIQKADPSRIGLGGVETSDPREGTTIARISARLSF